MATKRSTFQKRQRETDLKDKALAKQRRRAEKRERVKDGPIERGPDGLPLNTQSDADEGDAVDAAAPAAPAATVAAAPPAQPPRSGMGPRGMNPGPRGMSPGPRGMSPSPAPSVAPPAPAPAVVKTGPAPMYVPSKHLKSSTKR
jgi:hypothetical protein